MFKTLTLAAVAACCLAGEPASTAQAGGNSFIGTEVCTPLYVTYGTKKMIVNGCSPVGDGTVGLRQIRECFATPALCDEAAKSASAALPPYSWGGCPFICAP
jgi:hypothetical protein